MSLEITSRMMINSRLLGYRVMELLVRMEIVVNNASLTGYRNFK